MFVMLCLFSHCRCDTDGDTDTGCHKLCLVVSPGGVSVVDEITYSGEGGNNQTRRKLELARTGV